LSRVLAITDSLGRQTRYTYNPLNQVTQIKDMLGGLTQFSYDPNGNLLNVTDARNNATSYAYSNMDRVTSRTDPLLRAESYAYDNDGNPTSFTDRKSQVTGSTYDALGRVTQVTYQDGSTTNYTYDAGNRLTQVVDSVSGTTTLNYDNLDRLSSETTPQGSVSYTYDAAGRRMSMTVAGQPTVSYAYDNANRLTSITQGSSAVSFAYDNANRRTSLTLPNGITTEYAYDAASRLTGLTYKLGTTTLGNLTYGYNAAGERIQIGGTWARTGQPNAMTGATYNAASHQLTFGSQTLTYDLNGNLINDGTNTYTWNARNQLTAITGPVPATFAYDGFGRRTTKTISGSATQYLFDGVDLVQELAATGTTNYLRSLNIDEALARGSNEFYLADALGSAVALADPSSAVTTQYTYEPFGRTTVSGASTNPVQWSGRENDESTGLYFLRTRYYSPTLQRFLSEDPLEFAGGDVNFYAYVLNNPMSWTDPFGLKLCATNLPGMGATYLDDSIAPLVEDFIRRTTANGIDVRFTEAFRPTEYQDALTQNPNAITPVPPGTSLHEAGFAFDISWRQIRPEDRRAVVENARQTGLRWGGNFKKPDPVHFYKEVPGGRAKRSIYIKEAQGDYKKGNVPVCP
jgi:RHS repeat-associated protein